MKVKTSELCGEALNYAVTTIEGYAYSRSNAYPNYLGWEDAGPIIDREDIHWGFGTGFGAKAGKEKVVIATKCGHYVKPLLGPTALIAAMRCFVQSRLGDEVEIPEELTK